MFKCKSLIQENFRLFSQFKHEIVLRRKQKTKVIQQYEALPSWLMMKPRDSFDYPLRSLQSVREYQKLNPPDFTVVLEVGAVVNEHEDFRIRNRGVKLLVNIKEMRLTPKMEERLIFLLGPRYDQIHKKFKIKVTYFSDYEDNVKKAVEILRELYFEALRAP